MCHRFHFAGDERFASFCEFFDMMKKNVMSPYHLSQALEPVKTISAKVLFLSPTSHLNHT